MASESDCFGRTDAIELLRGRGLHAFLRDWAMGETIAVTARPFEHAGIQVWERVLYIAPVATGWVVDDLSGSPVHVESLGEACRVVLERTGGTDPRAR